MRTSQASMAIKRGAVVGSSSGSSMEAGWGGWPQTFLFGGFLCEVRFQFFSADSAKLPDKTGGGGWPQKGEKDVLLLVI